MPHASRRQRFARMSCHRLWAAALLGMAGCTSTGGIIPDQWLHGQQPRLQSDDDAQRDKDREIKTVGDVSTVANANSIPVSGVGLVVGLEGTGGHPVANGYRTVIENYLHKKGVEHVKEVLDSPDTSIVIVSGVVPAGARKGDPIDLDVTLPPQSRTRSLRGGYLKQCMLYNYDSKKHVDPNFKGPDGALVGHPIVEAEGALLVGFGAGNDGEKLKQGRIWGGGKSRIDRPFFLLLNDEFKRAAVAQLVSERLNETMQGSYHGTMTELASAKNNQVVVLSVPQQYKLNLPRFLRVARLVPLREAQGSNSPYRQQLEKDLLDPQRTLTAALRLEALGSDSIEALKHGLASDHALVKFCSAEALAYLGDPACGEVLAKTVAGQPVLRAFGLTAMASLDENVCRVRLGELLASASAEARYGAFRALRALDEHEPAVQGEQLNESFWLHRVAPQSPPLVHLAHSRRAEVVLFGDDAMLKPPFSFLSGEFTVTANRDDHQCTITRLSLYRGTSRRQCSLKLEEVLHTLGTMGATYPNVDELLVQADRCQCLSCPLAIDAVPQATSVYALVQSGAGDLDFKGDAAEIKNARLDFGATPTLFDKSTGRRPTPLPPKDDVLDDLTERRPVNEKRTAERR